MRYTQPQSGPARVEAWVTDFYLPLNGKWVNVGADKRGSASGTDTNTTYPVGVAGLCAAYDGTAYTRLGAATGLTGSPGVTFGCIIENTGAPIGDTLVFGKEDYFDDGFGIRNPSQNAFYVDLKTSGGRSTTPTITTAGGVVCAVATLIDNTIYLSINGSVPVSISVPAGTIVAASQQLTLGAMTGGSRFFVGKIYGAFAAPVATSVARIQALSANPWQLFKSPQRVLKVAGGGPASYSYTSSGGYVFSGTTGNTKTAIKTPTGGLTLLGTASAIRGITRSGSGGITTGGTATPIRSVVRAASGGILFAGAASVSFFSAVQSLTVVASGGMLLRGAATALRGVIKATTGGLLYGGSSSITLTPDPNPTTRRNFKRGRRPRTKT